MDLPYVLHLSLPNEQIAKYDIAELRFYEINELSNQNQTNFTIILWQKVKTTNLYIKLYFSLAKITIRNNLYDKDSNVKKKMFIEIYGHIIDLLLNLFIRWIFFNHVYI